MRINTKFPVAVHILSLIALSDGPVASEMMALSVGSHPVVIRQAMSSLKKAGLVETHNGIPGGKLTKPPEQITLREIYLAVKDLEKPGLFDLHPKPNPACPVGRNIKAALAAPLTDAQSAMENALEEYTLKDVMEHIQKAYSKEQNGGKLNESL